MLLMLIVLLGLGNTTPLVDIVSRGRYFTLLPIYYLPVLVGIVTTVAYTVYKIWYISFMPEKNLNKFSIVHFHLQGNYQTKEAKQKLESI